MVLAISPYGGRPVSSSITVQPRDQMSALVDAPLSSMTSGAIQKGVPTKVWRSVLVSCAATPKSASLTFPDAESRTLAALMSRWSFPSECR